MASCHLCGIIGFEVRRVSNTIGRIRHGGRVPAVVPYGHHVHLVLHWILLALTLQNRVDGFNHCFNIGQISYWTPTLSNDIAYADALNVLKPSVQDEGKKYSRCLTATFYRPFICIGATLLYMLYEHAEVHCPHSRGGLYFSEVGVSWAWACVASWHRLIGATFLLRCFQHISE